MKRRDEVELLPRDTQIADAARRAALAIGRITKTGLAGFIAESQHGDTRPLVEMLRQPGRSLGPGECAILADLISGELCVQAGGVTKKADVRRREREVLDRCRELMAQAKAEKRSKGARRRITQQVASETGMTEDEVAALWKNAKGIDKTDMSRAQFDKLAISDPAKAMAFMTEIRKGKARLVD